jgi:hypothetical protein
VNTENNGDTDNTVYEIAQALGAHLPAPEGSSVIHITVETEDIGRNHLVFEGLYPTREHGVTDLARLVSHCRMYPRETMCPLFGSVVGVRGGLRGNVSAVARRVRVATLDSTVFIVSLITLAATVRYHRWSLASRSAQSGARMSSGDVDASYSARPARSTTRIEYWVPISRSRDVMWGVSAVSSAHNHLSKKASYEGCHRGRGDTVDTGRNRKLCCTPSHRIQTVIRLR